MGEKQYAWVVGSLRAIRNGTAVTLVILNELGFQNALILIILNNCA